MNTKRGVRSLPQGNNDQDEDHVNDDDDCDNGSDDDDDDSSNNNRQLAITLPGGFTSRRGATAHPRALNLAPAELTYQIRTYLDVLFGTLSLAGEFCQEQLALIPYVVSAILQYNNIWFSTVRVQLSNIWLVEPIWYIYDIANNCLDLFVHEPTWEDYLLNRVTVPVAFKNFVFPLKQYDPLFTPVDTRPPPIMEEVALKLATMCDHVATHIMHAMHLEQTGQVNQAAEIHEGWIDYEGVVSLHSMFDVALVINGKSIENRDPLCLYNNDYRPYSSSFNTASPLLAMPRLSEVIEHRRHTRAFAPY